MIAKLATERPTSLCVVRDVVSPALDDAVMRALAKAPTDRFSSAREFADALTVKSVAPTTTRAAATARRNRMAAFGILAGGVAVAVAWAGFFRHSSSVNADAPATAGIRSIAVLPLDNYSGDSTQDYFAEGMTDELTTALATISRLRVTSRGSAMQFQGKGRPPTPEIAKTLNVDAVLEGSVTRAGDRVRVTAQLIDARADRHLWAQTFERKSSDVLGLEADLATAIAREINVSLTESEQSRLATAPTVNPEGHDAYLKGRYFFNRPSDQNLKKAIAQFEEAARLSPKLAAAYSGLSDAYLWAGYNEGFLTASQARPKARQAAEMAVQLDGSSAEAHTSLAVFKLFYEFDWKGSEAEFRRAIALNPNYAFAHDQFAMALAFTGRFDESVAESKRAAELDPLSPQVLIDATMAPMFRKDVAAAKALAARAGELDPSFFFPVMMEGWIDLEIRRFSESIPFLKKATTMDAPPFVTAYLAYAYGASGDRASAMAQLEALKKMSQGGQVLPFNLALFYLGLGDHSRALDNLERALAADSQMMAWIGRDAVFDSVRSEPRFVALMKKLHFVDK